MKIQTHPHCPYIYLDIKRSKEKVKAFVTTVEQKEDVDVDAFGEYNTATKQEFIQKP